MTAELSARRLPVARPRVVLLAMVFLGIVAMHVVAAHCSPAGSPPAQLSAASVASHHSDDLMTGVDHASHAPPAPIDAAGDSSQADAGDNRLGIVGICIATLAGLALILAATRAPAIRAWWLQVRHITTTLPPRSRMPRSFTLAELCLQRC
jgi:hypothetical protein